MLVGQRLCSEDEIPVGEMKVFQVGRREVAVARIASDRFHAFRNRCPHQGAPLGRGYLSGTFMPSDVGVYEWGREREIVRCPWHRYEFDAKTGRSLHDPQGCRVASYRVEVHDGFVELTD